MLQKERERREKGCNTWKAYVTALTVFINSLLWLLHTDRQNAQIKKIKCHKHKTIGQQNTYAQINTHVQTKNHLHAYTEGHLEGLTWHLFVCQHLFLSWCPEATVPVCILPYHVLHLCVSRVRRNSKANLSANLVSRSSFPSLLSLPELFSTNIRQRG